jgi:nucleoside-diphosphate-sugar epimerase
MRYLVTGACGFIGSHLCDALITAGHTVVAVDSGVIGKQRNVEHLLCHPNFKLDYRDVCDPFDFDYVDGIFHLASPTAPAETYKHPEMTLKVNSDSTWWLLEAAEKQKAKFLFASSIKVNDRQTFGSTYIQGKILGEKFCYESQFAKVARMGNVYGPRMAADDSRVIPTFIRNIINGKPLNVWGDGSQVDSFCYVDDVIKALVNSCFPTMKGSWSSVIRRGSPYSIWPVTSCKLPGLTFRLCLINRAGHQW